MIVGESAAQSTCTNGRSARRERRCTRRAARPLPVPVSPVRRRVESIAATAARFARSSAIARLPPTRPARSSDRAASPLPSIRSPPREERSNDGTLRSGARRAQRLRAFDRDARSSGAVRSRCAARRIGGPRRLQCPVGSTDKMDVASPLHAVGPEPAGLLLAAEGYERRIHGARGVRRLYRALESRAVARALRHAAGDRVLDCPCGTGRLDSILRARFREVVGLDRSEAMLAVYRRGDPARSGEVGDAFELPWGDGAFDWVISHRIFHHLQSDERRIALLRSFARVARQGVIVYAFVETPIRRGAFGRKAIPLERARRLLGEAGLELEAAYYAAWPIQPKVELVARKR